MTNEQIKIVNSIKFSIINAIDNIESEQMWEMIEKAYEQKEKEPCEDCVSREAVIKIFGEVHPMDYNTQAYITNIQNLPSVTPKAESKWGSIGNNTDLETVPTNLQDWLSTFNTESATECFTAVQQLKESVNE